MAKKLSLYASFLLLALGFSYAESFIPAGFLFPGFKPGFANLVPLTLLMYGHPAAALAVNLLRILISTLLFGSFSSLAFSLAGAAGSFLVMWLLCQTNRFSPIGISVAGGVMHNISQLLVSLIFLPISVMRYVSIFMAFGIIAGALMGVLCKILQSRFNRYLIILKKE